MQQGIPKTQHPPKPTRTLKLDFISSAIQEELERLEAESGIGDEDEEGLESDYSGWESVIDGEDGKEDEY